MLEVFSSNRLVNRIFNGDHDQLKRDFRTDFDHFTDHITNVCADPYTWHTNNAELIKLESNLELYNMAYSGPSEIVGLIIKAIVGFLRDIRAHFSSIHASFKMFRKADILIGHEDEDNQSPDNQMDIPADEVADIELIEAIEFIHGAAYKLFPKLSKSRVREKTNEYLGMNITDRQMHNNYSNIKRRMGGDHAQFFRKWHKEFNDHLTVVAAAEDERKKIKN